MLRFNPNGKKKAGPQKHVALSLFIILAENNFNHNGGCSFDKPTLVSYRNLQRVEKGSMDIGRFE